MYTAEYDDGSTGLTNNEIDAFWDLWGDAPSGNWILQKDIPTLSDALREDEAWRLEDHIDPDRLEALYNGAEPTEEENRLFHEVWLGYALDEPDADVSPGYVVASLADDQCPVRAERYALVLCTGYSFTGIRRWVEGLFANVEDALEYMRARGVISIEQ